MINCRFCVQHDYQWVYVRVCMYVCVRLHFAHKTKPNQLRYTSSLQQCPATHTKAQLAHSKQPSHPQFRRRSQYSSQLSSTSPRPSTTSYKVLHYVHQRTETLDQPNRTTDDPSVTELAADEASHRLLHVNSEGP